MVTKTITAQNTFSDPVSLPTSLAGGSHQDILTRYWLDVSEAWGTSLLTVMVWDTKTETVTNKRQYGPKLERTSGGHIRAIDVPPRYSVVVGVQTGDYGNEGGGGFVIRVGY